MQIMYLDSLDVDEPVPSATDCPVRAAAWTNQLIQAVIQKDTKPNGQFGKLRVRLSDFFIFFLTCRYCVIFFLFSLSTNQ